MKSDEKMKVSFNTYRDEYYEFKQICKEIRTTPTAMFVKFIRDTIKDYKEDKNNG